MAPEIKNIKTYMKNPTNREISILNYLRWLFALLQDISLITTNKIDLTIGYTNKKNRGQLLRRDYANNSVLQLHPKLFKIENTDKQDAYNMSDLIETFLHELTHHQHIKEEQPFYRYLIELYEDYNTLMYINIIPPLTINFFKTGVGINIPLNIKYMDQIKIARREDYEIQRRMD